MKTAQKFKGFPKEMITFFKDLKENNEKAWFEEHRKDYENFVKKPSIEYVHAMGNRLEEIAPDIVADPRVNKSLFRINRDTRFSKDKRPYKTHMGIWLWEGPRKRMENTGFYFHLTTSSLMLGCGIYEFPKNILKMYRDAVVDEKMGPALIKAVNKVKKEGLNVGVEHYKRIPRGYEGDGKIDEFLLYSGLTAHVEMDIPKEFHNEEFIEFAFGYFKKMLPVHEWLLKMTIK